MEAQKSPDFSNLCNVAHRPPSVPGELNKSAPSHCHWNLLKHLMSSAHPSPKMSSPTGAQFCWSVPLHGSFSRVQTFLKWNSVYPHQRLTALPPISTKHNFLGEPPRASTHRDSNVVVLFASFCIPWTSQLACAPFSTAAFELHLHFDLHTTEH